MLVVKVSDYWWRDLAFWFLSILPELCPHVSPGSEFSQSSRHMHRRLITSTPRSKVFGLEFDCYCSRQRARPAPQSPQRIQRNGQSPEAFVTSCITAPRCPIGSMTDLYRWASTGASVVQLRRFSWGPWWHIKPSTGYGWSSKQTRWKTRREVSVLRPWRRTSLLMNHSKKMYQTWRLKYVESGVNLRHELPWGPAATSTSWAQVRRTMKHYMAITATNIGRSIYYGHTV